VNGKLHTKTKGDLIIIGGGEEKGPESPILDEVASRAKRRKGPLVVITAATNLPEEVAAEYNRVFRDLGVRAVEVVDIRTREDAYDERNVTLILQASLIFFTGGDQLRITSQVGDSPTYRCMDEMYRHGTTIAGTSAGAAAMSETMLVSGPSDASYEAFSLDMAPGLGLIRNVVVDTHFAQRGRMGRILGAVAQNPRNLGIGIDEDTAIIVQREEHFRVLGSGAVYVADGTGLSYTSLSEKEREGVLSMFDMKLHVLSDNDSYDLVNRQPIIPKEATKVGVA
jgi:cyanophycinase